MMSHELSFWLFYKLSPVGLMDLLSRALESDESPMSRNSTENTFEYTKETIRNTTQKSPITRKELVTRGIKRANEEQFGSTVVREIQKSDQFVLQGISFFFFFLFSINTQCRKQVVMSFWFVFKQTNDELAFSVTGTGIRRPHTAITSVSIVVSFYFTFFLFSFLHLGFKPAMMCVCSGLTLAPCDLNPRPGISSSSC